MKTREVPCRLQARFTDDQTMAKGKILRAKKRTLLLIVSLLWPCFAWGLPEVSWSVINNDPPDFILAYKALPAGTPLPVFEAVLYGSQDVLSYLLSQGGDPNTRDSNGTPVLFWAAREGRVDLVEMLLKAGALSRATDALGAGWVSAAAQAPHLALLKLALKTSPQYAQTANILGDTPLLLAAQAGRLSAVQLLLASGADPTVTDYLGRTLQSMAQTSGNAALLTYVQGLKGQSPKKGEPTETVPLLSQEQKLPANPSIGNGPPPPSLEHPKGLGAGGPEPTQSAGQKKAS